MRTWDVHFAGAAPVRPGGAPLAPVWGDAPDMAAARAALDRWAFDARVLERLPRLGAFSPWWIVRVRLVHTHATAWMPWLRALTAMPRDFDRIVLHHPPEPWWPGLMQAAFPDCRISLQDAWPVPRPERLRVLGARALRATSTARRLARLSPPAAGRPRVLVVSRARSWNGARDIEMGPAIAALAASGLDPVVLDQTHEGLIGDLYAWRTRPADHLFGDYLFWRHLRAGGSPRPSAADRQACRIEGPLPAFELAGADSTALLIRTVEAECAHFLAGLRVYAETLPALAARLGVRAMLTVDETGGELGLTMGAVRAGLPAVAVQHGCIHTEHCGYLFPEYADPASIPLCARTCVYGEHYRGLLVERSIYPAETVCVTGQPQSDARPRAAMEALDAEAARLRREALPPGCDRLLLLSSQDLLADLLRARVLPAFAASHPRHFLVVRPHPREWNPAQWREALAQHGLDCRAALRPGEPLDPWLAACDVHIAATSTTLAEAAMMGRPNIVAGSRAVGDWMDCIAGGAGVALEDFPSLDAAVSHWLDAAPEPRAQHAAQRRAYVERHFGPLDGRAAERVAAAVHGVLG